MKPLLNTKHVSACCLMQQDCVTQATVKFSPFSSMVSSQPCGAAGGWVRQCMQLYIGLGIPDLHRSRSWSIQRQLTHGRLKGWQARGIQSTCAAVACSACFHLRLPGMPFTRSCSCSAVTHIWEGLIEELADGRGLEDVDAHAGNVRLLSCPAVHPHT